jgi:membrane-associated PAP2 superfamily phosphatase
MSNTECRMSKCRIRRLHFCGSIFFVRYSIFHIFAFRFLLGILLMASFGSAQSCAAQDAASPVDTNAPAPQVISSAPAADPTKKVICLKEWLRFAPDVLHSQKQIWLFPVSVAQGRHLKPTLSTIGLTAGLVALDPASGRYFQKTDSFKGFDRAFSGPNTSLAMQILPAAFFAVGVARRDPYAQKTFMLAGEAVLSSEILTTVMKDTSRRLNPGVVSHGNGDFSDTWFQKKQGSWIRGIGSFPSGHTIAAFSIATVFAKRYPKPRWFPWVAYGLAATVGFSRISLQSHFPSDVFLGAALGYTIAQNVVQHQ